METVFCVSCGMEITNNSDLDTLCYKCEHNIDLIDTLIQIRKVVYGEIKHINHQARILHIADIVDVALGVYE